MEEEWTEDNQPVVNKRENMILNGCFLIFVGILLGVTMSTFFIALFPRRSSGNAYNIASIFILCMLLALPALKLFLDKSIGRTMKTLNLIFLVAGFFAILIMTSAVCIYLVCFS